MQGTHHRAKSRRAPPTIIINVRPGIFVRVVTFVFSSYRPSTRHSSAVHAKSRRYSKYGPLPFNRHTKLLLLNISGFIISQTIEKIWTATLLKHLLQSRKVLPYAIFVDNGKPNVIESCHDVVSASRPRSTVNM
ncbi:hypothetical protein HRR90_001629 [Exophiala dermatitidis]|nr:hypothetical protein HRR74_002791 [Exophiala dermatitidis]KAJ4529535.1 hypothetical protein HRR73_000560 [Exophiala dermatitidis]KAJ4582910.1 hypothetical protein HRR81_001642 [Exophiala dermatitidis]KAJ4659275.1 hypothetical protein HRR90_001629 [Exophiala dermatitidis]KAJ4680888.1 hypothetical protein HRR93_002180 [Exophiala dermatitidis]